MAALVRKSIYFRHVSKPLIASHQIVRNHWNKDFKPDPYPETREERAAAAKKYNVHPAKYEAYPDDGTGYGSYPKLPDISADAKDPFYPWDFPEHKRNFGEPLHIQADLISEQRIDISYKPKYSPLLQISMALGGIFGIFAIYMLTNDYRLVPPVLPKQYPKPGVKHYTFDVE